MLSYGMSSHCVVLDTSWNEGGVEERRLREKTEGVVCMGVENCLYEEKLKKVRLFNLSKAKKKR